MTLGQRVAALEAQVAKLDKRVDGHDGSIAALAALDLGKAVPKLVRQLGSAKGRLNLLERVAAIFGGEPTFPAVLKRHSITGAPDPDKE